MIFGVDPANDSQTDSLLLPPHVTDPSEFYGLAMDVPNLPGEYRTSDDDDIGQMELLARVLDKGRSSYYTNWRKVSRNALARINSKKELMQFIKDVERSVP